MSDFILAEIAEREKAFARAAVGAAPTAQARIEAARAQAGQLLSGATDLEDDITSTAGAIKALLAQRQAKLGTADFLRRLAAEVKALESLATASLDNLVVANATGDKFAMLRWESGSVNCARLRAVEPFLPAFTKANLDAISALEKEIRLGAKDHGLDLKKLLAELRAGGAVISDWQD